MDAAVVRMQHMETTITDMAGRIDAYVNRVDVMMDTIAKNDINVKGIFDVRMGEMLSNTNKAIVDAAGIQQAQLQALQTEFGSKVAAMESRLQIASDYVAGAETAYIGMEQQQDINRNMIAAMEQEVKRITAESADFKRLVTAEITKLVMENEQGDNSGSGRDKKDSTSQ